MVFNLMGVVTPLTLMIAVATFDSLFDSTTEVGLLSSIPTPHASSANVLPETTSGPKSQIAQAPGLLLEVTRFPEIPPFVMARIALPPALLRKFPLTVAVSVDEGPA